MNKKIKVAILFGGKSAEHEVSLQSAKSIIAAIDKNKYDLQLIGIDKAGKWLAPSPPKGGINGISLEEVISKGEEISFDVLIPPLGGEGAVVFPFLHGPFGEDGTIQGLLKLMNIPFVGVGVLASAVGMDKDVTKRLLRDAGIKIARYITAPPPPKGGIDTEPNLSKWLSSLIPPLGGGGAFESIVKYLGLPFFIKPANAGSSVGVHKVTKKQDYAAAMEDAFQFDRKILIEENVSGREIECAVLGNEDPIASVPGEVIPQDGFYSYRAKYIDEKGAVLSAPAELSKEDVQRVQETAINAFKVLCCEGLARVDFFLRPNGDLILNEINTMPGFTSISMYPKLWELSGISYPQLIDKLITLALERHEQEAKLKTSYT